MSADAPVTRPDLDALIAEAWAIRPDKPHEGRGAASIARELAAALAAERARANQASPQMTVDQFREAVGVERASHAARGYDEAHDRTHGVPHLLRWALDYASRGEAVKSGALIVAALHLSEALEREERAIRARVDQAEQRIAAAIAIAAGAGDMNWEEDNYAAGAQHVAAALSPTALSTAPSAEQGADQ